MGFERNQMGFSPGKPQYKIIHRLISSSGGRGATQRERSISMRKKEREGRRDGGRVSEEERKKKMQGRSGRERERERENPSESSQSSQSAKLERPHTYITHNTHSWDAGVRQGLAGDQWRGAKEQEKKHLRGEKNE